MIVNTVSSDLMEELAGHFRAVKGRDSVDDPSKGAKRGKKPPKGQNNGLRTLKEKINKMAGLTEEEIQKAVEAELIVKDQSWNWIPSNMDCLREGLKDIQQGNRRGPFKDIDELISSLKP